MEPSRALLGCLASAAAAAPPGEDGAGAGAEEEEEEEEEAAAAAPGELGSDAPLPYWTAVFEYEAAGEDELTLRLGDVVEVLSKDSQVSGDEGWWRGGQGKESRANSPPGAEPGRASISTTVRS